MPLFRFTKQIKVSNFDSILGYDEMLPEEVAKDALIPKMEMIGYLSVLGIPRDCSHRWR